ncbi:hypothetical protein BV22DRAFT_1030138 [Leucogyrophana mollusca]|uniref:Uncharacterized protein n=1 Tax=Leucogyrophana mollusca TaxID=85980 RepID=A0ACB8BU44_9AGAM|nr:hypothetical protein BV22DRAFT_1030138 [Leucogyrophana mollusca]
MEFASSYNCSPPFQGGFAYNDDYRRSGAGTALHSASDSAMYASELTHSPTSFASSSNPFALYNQGNYYDDEPPHVNVSVKKREFSFEELQSGSYIKHLDESDIEFYRMYGQPVLVPCPEDEEGGWSLQDQADIYPHTDSKLYCATAQYGTSSYPYNFPITVSYTLAPALDESSSSGSVGIKREESSIETLTYDSQASPSDASPQTPSHHEWASRSEYDSVRIFKQDQDQFDHLPDLDYPPDQEQFTPVTQHTYALRAQGDTVASHMAVVPSQHPGADYVYAEVEPPHVEFEGPPMDCLPFPPNHSPSHFEFQSYSPVQDDTAPSPSSYGSPTQQSTGGVYPDSWGRMIPSPAPLTVPSQSYMFGEDTPSPTSATFVHAPHPSHQHNQPHRGSSPSHGHRRRPGSPFRRSPSPRGAMRISPLPQNKRLIEKKPALACLFCRGRKIACGPPSPGNKDKTCNQCARRHLKCEYPLESRRGMRKRRSLMPRATARATTPVRDNINSDGPKVTPSPRKRSVDKRTA